MKNVISRRRFHKGTSATAVGAALLGATGLAALAEETGIYTPGTYSASATVTSTAVRTAVAACIAKAKGEAVEIPVTTAEEELPESDIGDPTQTYEAEVVIAGAGAAGLQAAIHLCRAGKDVIIMEAGSSANSSNFAMCGGPAACETKLQEQENEWVSLDTLFNHMYNFSDTAVNGKLLKKVLVCTGTAMNDTMDLGVEMSLWPDAYDNGF